MPAPCNKKEQMKWLFLFTIEREAEIEADNLNEAVSKANFKKATEEKIVSIRLKR